MSSSAKAGFPPSRSLPTRYSAGSGSSSWKGKGKVVDEAVKSAGRSDSSYSTSEDELPPIAAFFAAGKASSTTGPGLGPGVKTRTLASASSMTKSADESLRRGTYFSADVRQVVTGTATPTTSPPQAKRPTSAISALQAAKPRPNSSTPIPSRSRLPGSSPGGSGSRASVPAREDRRGELLARHHKSATATRSRPASSLGRPVSIQAVATGSRNMKDRPSSHQPLTDDSIARPQYQTCSSHPAASGSRITTIAQENRLQARQATLEQSAPRQVGRTAEKPRQVDRVGAASSNSSSSVKASISRPSTQLSPGSRVASKPTNQRPAQLTAMRSQPKASGSSRPSSRSSHRESSQREQKHVYIDLTDDSPPPREDGRPVFRQAKLAFSDTRQAMTSRDNSSLPTSSSVDRSETLGSQDNPLEITPTPSPVSRSAPLPAARKVSSAPSIISISDDTDVSARPSPVDDDSSTESLPSLSQMLGVNMKDATAMAPSTPGRSQQSSSTPTKIKGSLPSPIANQRTAQLPLKRPSSSPDSPPPPSPTLDKRSKRLMSRQLDSASASPAPRSLRKRPEPGFFTMPSPGTPIRNWPQHVKNEYGSPRKAIVSPAGSVPPVPVRRSANRSTRSQTVEAGHETKTLYRGPSRSQRKTPRETSKMLEPVERNEIVVAPRTRTVTVMVSLRGHPARQTYSPPTRNKKTVTETGSMDSPLRSSASTRTTPRQAIASHQPSSPLTPLPARLTRGHAAVETPPHAKSGTDHLTRSDRKRLDFGEVVPTSVESEAPLWSPILQKLEPREAEAVQEEIDPDELRPLDPDEDADFFDSLGLGLVASTPVPASPPMIKSSPGPPQKEDLVPLPIPSNQAALDGAAFHNAALKAERLQKMREQIQESARAAVRAEAEEAARMAATLAAPPPSSDLSDDSDDELEASILAPRRSTRRALPKYRGLSLTPEPEARSERKPRVKQEVSEMDKMIRQIERKRKNGETAEDLTRLVASTGDRSSSSPAKRARLQSSAIPYPTPTSTGDQSPVYTSDRLISMANMEAVLGEDADLVQTLVGIPDSHEEASPSRIGDWPGFWCADVPEQIGEPITPTFEDSPVLCTLTEAAAAADFTTLVTLLNAGFAVVGVQNNGHYSRATSWLFELATLSRDTVVASSAFQSLADLAESNDSLGNATDLLKLLQNSIASFDVMSYNIELSRRSAAAEMWVRFVSIAIEHRHLHGVEVRSLVPALIQLAMDRTSSTSLKVTTAAAIAAGLQMCSEAEQAAICSDLLELFAGSDVQVHAAVVQSVGRSTEATRRLARRLAAGSLDPSSLETVEYHSPLHTDIIDNCLQPLRPAIENPAACETTVVALAELFAETLTDVEGLVPVWRQELALGDGNKRSQVESLAKKITRLQGRINDHKGENIRLSMAKSRLHHLSVVLGRLQMFFERKYRWTGVAGGILEPGVGGQTRLCLGAIDRHDS